MPKRKLLIVSHSPSENTRFLTDAVVKGASHPDIENVEVNLSSPFDANADDVMEADGIILGTTENLGYMSGALKDFFDRIYYACLEEKQGLPCAAWIRAGHDGTGTRRALETIITGLRWSWQQEIVVCRGEWQENFLSECEELGMAVSASLDLLG